MTKILVVSGEEIRAHFSPADLTAAVAEGYAELARGDVELTPKFHWEFRVGRGAAFGAFVASRRSMGVKVASIRPENPARALPRGILQIILHRPETGEPRALIDGSSITALRTGAAAAVGARALARPSSSVLAVIGAGVVGRAAAQAIGKDFDLREVRLVGTAAGRTAVAAKELRAIGLPAKEVVSSEEAVRGAEIIVTATPATNPVVRDDTVELGAHISAMGADWEGKQELDAMLVARAKVFVDRREQAMAIGEMNVPIRSGVIGPEHISAEIGEVLAGLAPGRTADSEITIFDSSGIGLQDVIAADVVVTTAEREGWGTRAEI